SGMADEATLAKIEALVNSPFRNGERHEESIALKEQLTILGYTDFTNPNSFYGSGTERGVREFQNDHDLPESGIADERTRALIQEKAEGPLQNPMYREDAVLLKEKLETAGFGSFAKTNYFGPQTEATVKAFQSYYGLTEDGIAGESTLAKLDEVVESPFQNGETHDESVVLKEHLTRLGFSSFSNPNGFYGSRTTQAVEEFQGHFGLVVNGIADSPTWNKIEEILSSPYQEGESSSAIADYKDMLIDLGFDEGISKGNSNFGSNTTKNVRNFQEEMGLPVSGILDEITIHLLEQADDRRPVYRETEYSVSLSEQLDIQAALRIGSAGLRRGPQTDQYSRNNAYVNNSDINVFEGGSITGSGVRLRTEPDTSSDNIKRSVSNGTVFEYIKSVNGSSVSGNTTWYEIKQEGDTLYVHSSLATTNGKVAEMKGTTEVYESQSRNSHVYYRLSTGTLVGVENEGSSWTRIAGRNWRDAKREDFKEYVDPQKQDEFQHLVLSASVNVPAQQLDNILDGRGALDGMGQAFIDGANQHNVNEAYLISHAILESGHGNSQLSRGIEVGTNSSGNPVLVTSSNRSSLSNIKEVHNMFGIGANDGVAHEAGAIRAYREGWDTREKAIIGGAKFIGERYIHNQYQQNTLYKMRWNPANPGYPQYATDMGWAAKQVSNIKSIYDDLVNPVMIFDIPVYR
ncbi:mannosyl-glycoprotein endo-beta-N-acetylglucosaminidase, partial [Pelagirhabdus alkalitolerans]